jgi:hypothetical protein
MIHTSPIARTASHPPDTRKIFPCVKQSKAYCHSFVTTVMFKNVWSFTATCQFVFMAWETILLPHPLFFEMVRYKDMPFYRTPSTCFNIFGTFRYLYGFKNLEGQFNCQL